MKPGRPVTEFCLLCDTTLAVAKDVSPDGAYCLGCHEAIVHGAKMIAAEEDRRVIASITEKLEGRKNGK